MAPDVPKPPPRSPSAPKGEEKAKAVLSPGPRDPRACPGPRPRWSCRRMQHTRRPRGRWPRPGRKCQLSPRPRVRTGAKEGTGLLHKKKIPLQKAFPQDVRAGTVCDPAGLRGMSLSPLGWGQPGKGHQWGTGSVPPALPVSPQLLTGQE